jgi:hypothetical protein
MSCGALSLWGAAMPAWTRTPLRWAASAPPGLDGGDALTPLGGKSEGRGMLA